MSDKTDSLTTDNLEIIYQNDLQNIYSKLTITENCTFFEIESENDFLLKCIETVYDKNFKQILTEDLQTNIELINNKFVILVKFCLDKNFKKCGIIFISFCDYFALDFNKTFLSLHEKLQNLIKRDCKNLVGGECFKTYIRKSIESNQQTGGVKIKTLFDIVANK